jgi:hypothetical protein
MVLHVRMPGWVEYITILTMLALAERSFIDASMVQSGVEACKAPNMDTTIMRQLPGRKMGMMVGRNAHATAGHDTIPS